MRFQILGSLQLWDGQGWSAVASRRQRLLLAVLLLDAGRAVGVDRLVEELWGDNPPGRAVAAVQVYLGRLRRLLAAGGMPDRLVTHRSGYRLRVHRDEVDSSLFDRLATRARAERAADNREGAVERFAEALALWRGPALADVPASTTVTVQADWWNQARLNALEDKLGTELEIGRHNEIVQELGKQVAENPMRERLHAYHMLALYRCGRRADALAAYRDARRALVDQLGLEPGPELREIERAILADERQPVTTPVQLTSLVPGRVVPAQLPAAAAGFTGRAAQLRKLDNLLGDGVGPNTVVITTIAGTAGVGKTALALQWAHRNRERFPDGQLYLNLRGYAADRPLRPIDALARYLPALGVPAEQVPTEPDQAAALYRSVLAGRRVLVLLDNANHPDQVRPLLPGIPGCPVLVTSRDQLRGLIARDGAVRLDLDALTPDEAQALLVHLLGPDRVSAEVVAAARLARLCGYLPLALRIVAANLTSRPHVALADYATRLAGGERLDALDIDEDPEAGVRAALDLSYCGRPENVRRQFRLLGLVPGPDVTAEAAGALAGITVPVAERLLDQLATAHLVHEHLPGRYTLHDLVRLYAAERAGAEESQPDRQAALVRLFEHYQDRVDAAAELLHPHIVRLPPPPGRAPDPAAGFDDPVAAVAWLDTERPNLVAAVSSACEHGLHESAYRLADALRGYLYAGGYTVDWKIAAVAALAAAEAAGDLYAQAAARISVAGLDWYLDQYESAADQFGSALTLARRAGWTAAQAAILLNLGNVHWSKGQLAPAAEHYGQALALEEQTASPAVRVARLFNLGITYFGLGRLTEAADVYQRALDLCHQLRSPAAAARCLACLGETYHAMGRQNAALDLFTEALDRATGDHNVEAITRSGLAAVHRDMGHDATALEHATTAVQLAHETNNRRLESDTLVALGSIYHHCGRHHDAIDTYQQALRLAREIHGPQAEAHSLTGLAAAHLQAGDIDQAAERIGESIAIARWGGYRLIEADGLTVLAAIRVHTYDPLSALELVEQAISIHTDARYRLGEARAHLVTEAVLRQLNRISEADAHQRKAHQLFTAVGVPIAHPWRCPAPPGGPAGSVGGTVGCSEPLPTS